MNFDDPERQGFANISDAVEDLVKGVVHVELEGKHYAAGKVKTWYVWARGARSGRRPC